MYSHENLGTNSRLDSIQAAVLRVKLPYLNEWNERRRYNASLYDQLLKGSEIMTPFCAEGNTHVYNQYPIRLKNRDEVMKELNKVGIPVKVHYRVPLHLQKVFKYLGYKKGDFPVTEEVSDTILSLPIHPEMSEEEIHFIAGKVVDTVKT